MLPDGDGILRDAGSVLDIVILSLSEEPATVAMPKPELGVVRISFLIALGMVAKVVNQIFRSSGSILNLAATEPNTSFWLAST